MITSWYHGTLLPGIILLFRLPSDNVQRLYQSCHPPIVYTKRVTINRIMIHSFIISKKQSPFFSSSLHVLVCILSSPTRRRFHPQQSCGQKGRVVTGIYLLNNNSIPGMYVYVCYGAVPPPRPVLTILSSFLYFYRAYIRGFNIIPISHRSRWSFRKTQRNRRQSDDSSVPGTSCMDYYSVRIYMQSTHALQFDNLYIPRYQVLLWTAVWGPLRHCTLVWLGIPNDLYVSVHIGVMPTTTNRQVSTSECTMLYEYI